MYYQLQKCTHMHSYGDAILSVNTYDLPSLQNLALKITSFEQYVMYDDF